MRDGARREGASGTDARTMESGEADLRSESGSSGWGSERRGADGDRLRPVARAFSSVQISQIRARCAICKVAPT